MKVLLRKYQVLFAVLVVLNTAEAQRAPTRQIVRVPDDVVKLKQLADEGNLHAQLALAKKYAASDRFMDSLDCYYKAAEKGSLDAIYQVGHILLLGAASAHASQKVEANPEEGIKWIFRAATNLYPAACGDMSYALQRGLGVRTDSAQAYAWLLVYADRDPNRGTSASEDLALRLTTQTLIEGKKIAGQLRKSEWPRLQFAAATRLNVPLKLTGVTIGGPSPLAIINRRTIGLGESTSIPLEGGTTITVKCLEIREDCVLIEVTGEGQPRWLRFFNSVAAVAGP